jgi:hypothetical protein
MTAVKTKGRQGPVELLVEQGRAGAVPGGSGAGGDTGGAEQTVAQPSHASSPGAGRDSSPDNRLESVTPASSLELVADMSNRYWKPILV